MFEVGSKVLYQRGDRFIEGTVLEIRGPNARCEFASNQRAWVPLTALSVSRAVEAPIFASAEPVVVAAPAPSPLQSPHTDLELGPRTLAVLYSSMLLLAPSIVGALPFLIPYYYWHAEHPERAALWFRHAWRAFVIGCMIPFAAAIVVTLVSGARKATPPTFSADGCSVAVPPTWAQISPPRLPWLRLQLRDGKGSWLAYSATTNYQRVSWSTSDTKLEELTALELDGQPVKREIRSSKDTMLEIWSFERGGSTHRLIAGAPAQDFPSKRAEFEQVAASLRCVP